MAYIPPHRRGLAGSDAPSATRSAGPPERRQWDLSSRPAKSASLRIGEGFVHPSHGLSQVQEAYQSSVSAQHDTRRFDWDVRSDVYIRGAAQGAGADLGYSCQGARSSVGDIRCAAQGARFKCDSSDSSCESHEVTRRRGKGAPSKFGSIGQVLPGALRDGEDMPGGERIDPEGMVYMMGDGSVRYFQVTSYITFGRSR